MKYAKQRKLIFSDKQDSINQEIFERFELYVGATSETFKAALGKCMEVINKAIRGLSSVKEHV